MSDPKLWNGTAWVRPSFHVGGGVWKTYIPPVWDTPYGDFQFPANNQGWTWTPGLSAAAGAGWSGGIINGNTGTGIFDFGSFDGPTLDPLNDCQPGQYGARCRMMIVQNNPDGVNSDVTFPAGTGGTKHVAYLVHNTWTTITTPALYDTAVGYGNIPASVQCGIVDGGHNGHFTAHIDWWQLWDVTRNQPAYALSAPGWEPKVYRADGSWK